MHQTDIPGYARAYRMSIGENAAWRGIRCIHSGAARTLAPGGEVQVGYVGRMAAEKRVDLPASGL